ncbi:hypothetical protein C0992_006156 [Termitomyces sp. T32_za158]|nr:hypothetical protein C0992_006156 [Termitomyces sp. T32_za158]
MSIVSPVVAVDVVDVPSQHRPRTINSPSINEVCIRPLFLVLARLTVLSSHPSPRSITQASTTVLNLVLKVRSPPPPPAYLRLTPPGCPIAYIPLSVHLPDYFLQLQQRQRQYSQEKAWWPSDKAAASPVILSSRGAQPQDSHIQQEIQAAISEPMDKLALPDPQGAELSNHLVKTSSTHPINRNALVSKGPVSSYNDFDVIQTPAELSTHTSPMTEPSLMLGNLFLSSCPGKKGKSLRTVAPMLIILCLDLSLDLKRMKELGVGCIICCLDDGELDFLGAPWSEYENLANDNGIDVFRIPIPEGLAPLSPASLDANLTKIITTYTLRGVPVLVHCRGGVGRAGVIACCWLIRLGLCGWIEPRTSSSPDHTQRGSSRSRSQDEIESTANPLKPRQDTILFVQKVIAVARRRRSMKAVETYEQVCFLVDFVEYLRNKPFLDEI